MQVHGGWGIFAMMNMDSHTQAKTPFVESVDDRLIMFWKQEDILFHFTTFSLSCFENKLCCFTFLAADCPYLSHHTDTTYDLSTLNEGVKILDLEQLKTDAVNCLTYCSGNSWTWKR